MGFHVFPWGALSRLHHAVLSMYAANYVHLFSGVPAPLVRSTWVGHGSASLVCWELGITESRFHFVTVPSSTSMPSAVCYVLFCTASMTTLQSNACLSTVLVLSFGTCTCMAGWLVLSAGGSQTLGTSCTILSIEYCSKHLYMLHPSLLQKQMAPGKDEAGNQQSLFHAISWACRTQFWQSI